MSKNNTPVGDRATLLERAEEVAALADQHGSASTAQLVRDLIAASRESLEALALAKPLLVEAHGLFDGYREHHLAKAKALRFYLRPGMGLLRNMPRQHYQDQVDQAERKAEVNDAIAKKIAALLWPAERTERKVDNPAEVMRDIAERWAGDRGLELDHARFDEAARHCDDSHCAHSTEFPAPSRRSSPAFASPPVDQEVAAPGARPMPVFDEMSEDPLHAALEEVRTAKAHLREAERVRDATEVNAADARTVQREAERRVDRAFKALGEQL